jgi:non-lysosomal glucosylceramidase
LKKIYKGSKAKEISFPLGGIGTGSIGLAGNGRLQSPYIGEYVREFPLAEMTFSDNYFPGNITMNAFNPLIPLNDLDSSIPAAFFEIEFENATDLAITYTACLSVGNRELAGLIRHQHHVKEAGTSTLHITKLSSSNFAMDDPRFGDISLATDVSSVSYQEFWYRGGWWDNLEMFWRDFTKPGHLINRSYTADRGPHPRHNDMSSIAAHIELLPGAKEKMRFVISWSYPNCQNFWNPEKGDPTIWKNYYATLFEDSSSSAAYALQHWDRLYEAIILLKKWIHKIAAYLKASQKERPFLVIMHFKLIGTKKCRKLNIRFPVAA